MLNAVELKLNRIAQGLISRQDGCAWFEAMDTEERQETLKILAKLCHQAHPLKEEVPAAIKRSELRSTFTPCVLLDAAEKPEQSFAKIISLPIAEQVKSFRLLMALFAIADQRRRETHCKGGCTHEWHNLTSALISTLQRNENF